MKKTLFSVLMSLAALFLQAQTVYHTVADLPYLPVAEPADTYRTERCKLDVYYPLETKGFATVVWFHGGGLEQGSKHIPAELCEQGLAVVAVNYRLSPRAHNPAYIEDAAAAVAWTLNHIESYGGDHRKVFVAGHSAGGYLALMLAMDKQYLAAYGADADAIAGYFPLSGQTLTHYTIRKERGLPGRIPVVDEYAPLNRLRADTPPMVLVTGDRTLELANRWEENILFVSSLKNIGNKNVRLHELQGFDHGTMLSPGCVLTVHYIREWLKKAVEEGR